MSNVNGIREAANALFSKYYNKWFVAPEVNFPWTNDPSAVKNARVLARLVKKSGSNYNEVELKKGETGDQSSFFVLRTTLTV